MQERKSVDLIRMGRISYLDTMILIKRIADALQKDVAARDSLLLVEHPPVLTVSRSARAEDLGMTARDPGQLAKDAKDEIATELEGEASFHGPGQLVAYSVLKLQGSDSSDYMMRLEQVVLEVLKKWGISGRRDPQQRGVWVGQNRIAALHIAPHGGVATHGLALNVDPDLTRFQPAVPYGLQDGGIASMRSVLSRNVSMDEVEKSFVSAFGLVFDCEVSLRSKPGSWLIASAPGDAAQDVGSVVSTLGLNTVCQEASCPNLGECWERRTATFMILGSTCTRRCRFCNVNSGAPSPPDASEPARIAEGAVRLGLKHVVLTSVTRDDLADGGAGQFAGCVQAIRKRLPKVTIEVLVPDFQGSTDALKKVFAARPDVFNHNVETVERLTSQVRDGARYSRSLDVLAQAKQSGLVTKSGIMVGLGETCGEVLQTMRDLRNSGCDMLTIGQYLRPAARQMKVVEFIHPIMFDWFAELGKTLGFVSVKSGPLVRSSYHAKAN